MANTLVTNQVVPELSWGEQITRKAVKKQWQLLLCNKTSLWQSSPSAPSGFPATLWLHSWRVADESARHPRYPAQAKLQSAGRAQQQLMARLSISGKTTCDIALTITLIQRNKRTFLLFLIRDKPWLRRWCCLSLCNSSSGDHQDLVWLPNLWARSQKMKHSK